MADTYTSKETDRIIKEIVNSGSYDFAKIFPKDGEDNRYFVGISYLNFENGLFDSFKGDTGKIDSEKEYTILKKIFSESGVFEQTTDESNAWEPYIHFKSLNGIFYMHLETTDPSGYLFPILLDKDEWFVGFAMSNYSKALVKDIASAFEKYFGFKVFYKKEIIRDATFGAYCDIYLSTEQFDC